MQDDSLLSSTTPSINDEEFADEEHEVDFNLSNYIHSGDSSLDSSNSKNITMEPYVAALHACGVNSITTDKSFSYLLTGGEDGLIRSYDIWSSLNGKLPLTQQQRHPFVDTITKSAICSGVWNNEVKDKPPSPVHSVIIDSNALFGLSGTTSGTINLFTIRHSLGQIHHVLQDKGHTSLVSTLCLSHDEKQLFSGGWDNRIIEWDLNTGQTKRRFEGHTSQITSLSLRRINNSQNRDGSYDPLFDDDDGDSKPQEKNLSLPNSTTKPDNIDIKGSSNELSNDVLMSSSIDGQVYIWDRRASNPKAIKIDVPNNTPRWSTSAIWSENGLEIYVGRRNSTIESFDIRNPKIPQVMRLPSSSGPVTSLATLPTNHHLISASFDNIRLWNTNLIQNDSKIPFKIIPGHHGGFVSQLLVDSTGKFVISASGNRGWAQSNSTDVVLFHEIKST